ncbi:hypothetical protein C5B42_04950 [Candidatus Cerribacteria bacterium 'Amazon FNV 2010 28 9']|uniref:Uncharacterized protein n=1 Tax=Candidatus Cerribacteria bacterium 'Amazon FNV 2010 28 9' TaxID=2081795 RepID=A0A317JMZ4_9BACT|nr:MAG: hypothetical protein C5B42_04950 [Candidatus Cerribacteria bacterium 'Amazon FNV 2010 28 9']
MLFIFRCKPYRDLTYVANKQPIKVLGYHKLYEGATPGWFIEADSDFQICLVKSDQGVMRFCSDSVICQSGYMPDDLQTDEETPFEVVDFSQITPALWAKR